MRKVPDAVEVPGEAVDDSRRSDDWTTLCARQNDGVAEEREVGDEDHLHGGVGATGDEERSFVGRHSKALRVRRWSSQRIEALQSWVVSKANENAETQHVDELAVVLHRIVLTRGLP